MRTWMGRRRCFALLCAAWIVVSPIAVGESGEPLRVVATTTIVADVVRSVAGELVDLRTLLPVGVDPHAFQPTPRDAIAVADADVLMLSGAGLEAEFEDVLANARGAVIDLSEGVPLLAADPSGDEAADRDDDEDHHVGDVDPHVWFDPRRVALWVDAIVETVRAYDPANAERYEVNAAAYRASLSELDRWIAEWTARIPPERRRLITDHRFLGYFAARYGFEVSGAIFPGLTTLAEPSAKDLAALIETIRSMGTPAIFVGETVNPAIAETIATDTGTRIITLYTGSLSEATGPAATYLEMMRFNVEAIVAALTL